MARMGPFVSQFQRFMTHNRRCVPLTRHKWQLETGNSHIVPNTQGSRPTNPIPASLVSLVAGVYRSPNFFRARSRSGQSNGGGVFLRISAVREDGAGVLSGGGGSRVVVLSVAEAVFELNASTEA
jgi:hypothetical protein